MRIKKNNGNCKFNINPSPEGSAPHVNTDFIFVLHRHLSHQLHYDLRLCIDDVLKSWALPKGPSMNPKDKRLAIQVEDHPYVYKDFKGVISKGYGAGIVEIWDEGELLLPEGVEADPNNYFKQCIRKGELFFRLKGKKLKGAFALIKTDRLGADAWLLIKKKDVFSIDQPYMIEAFTSKNSPINRWLKKNSPPFQPEANTEI